MVSFICYTCNKTIAKKQVETHFQKCRKPINIVCIDCKKTFMNNEYIPHTSCISEQQATHGQYYKPKQNNANPNQPALNTSQNQQAAKKTAQPQAQKPVETPNVEQIVTSFKWKKYLKLALKENNNSLSYDDLREKISGKHLEKTGNEVSNWEEFDNLLSTESFTVKKVKMVYLN